MHKLQTVYCLFYGHFPFPDSSLPSFTNNNIGAAYRTLLEAGVPRVKCREHGVVTVPVPRAEPGSGYTAMFEALVIDWLKEAAIAVVSRLMGLSWTAIDGIMQRAVKRGLAGRKEAGPTHIGVDETSFRKRHDYVTIVSDQDEGTVQYVGSDRKKATLKNWYRGMGFTFRLRC